MTYVDISSACTDKWISRDGKVPAGIEGATLDSKYLADGKIEGEGFSFVVPHEGNDIARCFGQRIELPRRKTLRYLDFAGFAVFGGFREDFMFEYADGSAEIIKMSYVDVCGIYPKMLIEDREKYCYYGERFFNFLFPKNGEMIDGVIYAHRLNLPHGKVPIAVTLPENFFVCICGITLWD